jgi:hypothetical protein
MKPARTALVALLGAVLHAHAWFDDGHRKVTGLAIELTGANNLPAFFAQDHFLAISAVGDPDLFRERSVPVLRDQEAPDHFINPEPLGAVSLPTNRFAFVALCAAKGIAPQEVGFLPYAVMEWTERLTMAFVEHRRWPENRSIRAKCLLYAGLLAHYAGDLTQPLHTTVHYDGRIQPGAAVRHTGIHARVDALLTKYAASNTITRVELSAYPDPWQGISDELERTRALVDRVYALKSVFPAVKDPLPDDPALNRFVRERLDATAVFTARLYLSAWERSARIEIPAWRRDSGTTGQP